MPVPAGVGVLLSPSSSRAPALVASASATAMAAVNRCRLRDIDAVKFKGPVKVSVRRGGNFRFGAGTSPDESCLAAPHCLWATLQLASRRALPDLDGELERARRLRCNRGNGVGQVR